MSEFSSPIKAFRTPTRYLGHESDRENNNPAAAAKFVFYFTPDRDTTDENFIHARIFLAGHGVKYT